MALDWFPTLAIEPPRAQPSRSGLTRCQPSDTPSARCSGPLAFSRIAVATIGLGIAANTAIFSVVNGVLLKPLPFRDEGRVVKVSTATRDEKGRQLGLTEEAPPLLFLPYEQFPLPFTTVAVRSSLPQGTVTSILKAQMAAIDPNLPFGDITPLQSAVASNVDQPRFRALLIGVSPCSR